MKNNMSMIKVIIGISGGSCSGKTWLANQIKSIRPQEVTIFDLDSYYKPQEYVSSLQYRHDNPEAINFELAIEQFRLLKNGEEITIPIYDFETHQIKGEKIIQPNPLIIVEGIFAFSHSWFKEQMDLKVWIDAKQEKCLARRIDRDIKQRGRSKEEVMHRYSRDVTPAYDNYIYPNRQDSDLFFENNNDDHQATKMMELILKYLNQNGVLLPKDSEF